MYKSEGSKDPQARLLGVDTGGTFTDFIFTQGKNLQVLKLPSTPDAPEQAVLRGAQSISSQLDTLSMVHGSTVATNALLEGKLARCVYITNSGLADVLSIGRQARKELYNLQPAPQAPPVPAALCLEVDARSDAQGKTVQPLSEASLSRLLECLRELKPQAVAINLLFSYKDASTEQRIAEAVRATLGSSVAISCSSGVLPEYREYERGIATWLNVALAPRMQRYLRPLQAQLKQLAVMHSAAGTVAGEQASAHAVKLLLSGPAAGLLGARYVGQLAGCEQLLSFDMGGTSTDVAMLNCTDSGQLRLTSEAHIAGYPVAVPMVDMHTIGAGGGSIARLDAGGMLCVGPQSAGAMPGPACYGHGGREPTVTDANVVLGRLPATSRLGDHMALHVDAAGAALAGLAEQMQVSVEVVAAGVIEVANEAMAKALRVISVQKGVDPDNFTLLSFGGAGGLHVCALAQALGMRNALVPVYAGVLSALGMLVARRSRQLSQSLLRPLAEVDTRTINAAFNALERQGAQELEQEGVNTATLSRERSVDVRYLGQSFSLNLAWRGRAHIHEDFQRAHTERYGHALELPVELVNVRVSLLAPPPALNLPRVPPSDAPPKPKQWVAVQGCEANVALYDRNNLLAGQSLQGPAIISEQVATTWLAPGWMAQVDGYGNLLLQRVREAVSG